MKISAENRILELMKQNMGADRIIHYNTLISVLINNNISTNKWHLREKLVQLETGGKIKYVHPLITIVEV